jgi:hypothetical protein
MDPWAADVIGTKLLSFQVQVVCHLWEAGRQGVGEVEIEKMAFPALSPQDVFGAFTTRAVRRICQGRFGRYVRVDKPPHHAYTRAKLPFLGCSSQPCMRLADIRTSTDGAHRYMLPACFTPQLDTESSAGACCRTAGSSPG